MPKAATAGLPSDLPHTGAERQDGMTTMLKAMLALGLLGAWAQEPRELSSEKDHWLNSTQAIKLADLKGKVVWLEFGVLS